MVNLELDIDEGVVLQTTEVERYGEKDESLNEIILTNKNIICVSSKSTGMFSKSEIAVEKIELSTIKIVNNRVQVMIHDSDDYGKGLQIFFCDGHREHFVFYNNENKELPLWLNAIKKTVAGESPDFIDENNLEKEKEKHLKKFPKSESQSKDSFEKETAVNTTNNDISKNKNMHDKKLYFCAECGNKLVENALFCDKCGTKVNDNEFSIHKTSKKEDTQNNVQKKQDKDDLTERKTIYEGKIHKCPNCGETIEGFKLECTACGYVFRDSRASKSIEELSAKLEMIESRRIEESNCKKRKNWDKVSSIDKEKESLIRSFPIPNNKEALLEFFFLAQSNIDLDSYANKKGQGALLVSDAWKAKLEQAYQKASFMLAKEGEFKEVLILYQKTQEEIKRAKKKASRIVLWFWVVIVVIFVFLVSLASKEEIKENERLENIIVEVQEFLDKQEYKHALRIADSIDYQSYDKEMERKWDIEREYWTDKVIKEASKNGIELDYVPSIDIDNANDKTEALSDGGGFVEGFKEGLRPGLDAAKENIDEFNRILTESTSKTKKGIE